MPSDAYLEDEVVEGLADLCEHSNRVSVQPQAMGLAHSGSGLVHSGKHSLVFWP